MRSLTPKAIINRSQFPTADDEYTPAQRKAIDARLAKGLADVKAGWVHGPFRTNQELIEFLHAQIRMSKGKSKTKPKRR
jgi:hypothetical protein